MFARHLPVMVSEATLREWASQLPAQIIPSLYGGGPRALERARVVRRLLERPLILLPPSPVAIKADPDRAVLAAPAQEGVVADI